MERLDQDQGSSESKSFSDRVATVGLVSVAIAARLSL